MATVRDVGGGGGEIERGDGMRIGLTAGDGAGVGDEEGGGDAAFGEHALFAIQRCVQASVPASGITIAGGVNFVNL